MKKTYIIPEIRVTELTDNVTILAGSDTGSNGGYDTGGEEGMDEDNSKAAKWGSVWE